MKNLTLSVCSIALLGFSISAQTEPLAFYKRCLVTSITGGPSSVLYTTWNNGGEKVHSDKLHGSIDPLILEYGITNKFGVGISKGGETYRVNANDFYKANVPDPSALMWTSTKYLTLDFSYHPFVTKRIDISTFASAGYFKVEGTSYLNENTAFFSGKKLYSYDGRGAVVRAGVRSRIYFTKRFGAMGMLYAFNGIAKEKSQPNSVSDAPNNTGYKTMLSGVGAEFGICFRLFKQKGVKPQTSNFKKLMTDYKNKKANKENEDGEEEKTPLFRLVWD